MHPATGIQGQCLAAPAVEQIQRLLLAHTGQPQRGFGGGHRQDFERDLQQHAQRAQGARHQSGDVIAGDIFHDLATKGQCFAAAVDDLDAQNEIAQRAHAGAGRPAQTAGHHAAHRGARAEMRRLKGQALALAGQQVFKFR